jgi:hypothetical protein
VRQIGPGVVREILRARFPVVPQPAQEQAEVVADGAYGAAASRTSIGPLAGKQQDLQMFLKLHLIANAGSQGFTD